MKLLIASRHTCRLGLGFSTYGFPFKGEPWVRRINGLRFATRTSVYWLTFRHHELTRPHQFVTDLWSAAIA